VVCVGCPDILPHQVDEPVNDQHLGVTLHDVVSRAQVPWTVIDDRVVVCSADGGLSAALDPVSSVLWRCLDQTSPLGDVIADVAEAFEVAPHDAAAAFGPVVSSWRAAGLVDVTCTDRYGTEGVLSEVVGETIVGDTRRTRRRLMPPPDG
jgi:hypothetical protein